MADRHDPHADHDPLVIAGLLDRDLTPVERAAAEGLVATCPDCAALHAELLALSNTARELPAPARVRDFQLTSTDAERLVAMARREPANANARPTGVMTDRTTTPHATHDEMLVASLADHSLPDADRKAAEALVASCRDCADLHADIVALRAATAAMPTPARPSDYTLTADDAARLRSRGWRRLVSAFGTARDSFSRPLAVGLTTLGIAGLLVASLPSIIAGGVTSGFGTLTTVGAGNPGGPLYAAQGSNSATENRSGAPAVPAAAAPTAAPSGGKSVDAGGPITSSGPVAQPAASPGEFGVTQSDRASPGPVRGTGQGAAVTGGASPTPAEQDTSLGGTQALEQLRLPPLAIVSGVFLLVGLGLFAIRWGARRLGDG